jgi:exonuclease VII small subunit
MKEAVQEAITNSDRSKYTNELDYKFNSSKLEAQSGVIDEVAIEFEKTKDYKKFCMRMIFKATENVEKMIKERKEIDDAVETEKKSYGEVVETRGQISGKIIAWNSIHDYVTDMSSKIGLQEYKERPDAQ